MKEKEPTRHRSELSFFQVALHGNYTRAPPSFQTDVTTFRLVTGAGTRSQTLTAFQFSANRSGQPHRVAIGIK